MSTTVEAEPVTGDTSSSVDTLHAVCLECDTNVAFCGLDVTDEPWATDGTDDLLCVVCADVVNTTHRCPRCGAPFGGDS
jgi:hypothetical protein